MQLMSRANHFTPLKVPICFKYFTNLGSQVARNLQLRMDPVLFLIIDEFSMIKCHVMTDLKQRCYEGKEDIDRGTRLVLSMYTYLYIPIK